MIPPGGLVSGFCFWVNTSIIRGASRRWVWHKGPMIVTEHGLTFARADDAWRCVERPRLWMLRSGCRFDNCEQEFPTLAAALVAELKSEEVPRELGAAEPTWGYFWGYPPVVSR